MKAKTTAWPNKLFWKKLSSSLSYWFSYLSILLGSSSCYATLPDFNYDFTINASNEMLVEVSFIGSEEGKTTLLLPNEWAGNSDLFKSLEIIDTGTAKLENGEKPIEKILHHAPNETIRIKYRVWQSFDGKPDKQQAYRPVFNSSYFHFMASTMLIAPNVDFSSPVNVNLTWHLPSGWSIANSYGANNQKQHHITTTLNDLYSGIYVGGNFHIIHRSLNGRPLFLAVHQDWDLTNANNLANAVQPIITLQRDFFDDHSSPYYLIVALPIIDHPNNMGGTALHRAFTIFASPQKKFDSDISWLISHEHFHNWNHPNLFSFEENSEPLVYWFTEGITDYYASKFLLKGNLATFQDYIDEYNQVLLNYHTSPEKTCTNDKVKNEFWTNYDIEKIPYQRGNILAHNWNSQIKRESNNQLSFNDFFKAVLMKSKSSETSTQLTRDQLIEISKDYFSKNISHDLKTYIDQGNLLNPDPDSLGPCCLLKFKQAARYRAGFPITTDPQAGVVSFVRPGSRAAKLGLKEGDKLLNVEFELHDLSKNIRVTFDNGHEIKTIEYPPYDGDLQTVPYFEINESILKEKPDSCLKDILP